MQLFVNDLTVIDFSYLCPKRGMVGESWIVDIVLDGALNEQSMVLDFGRVKKQIKAIIDRAVDHKLAVPAEHSYTQVTRQTDGNCYWVDFLRPEQRSIHLFCPADAFAFIDAEQVTIETVTSYLRAVIKRELPDNIAGLQLLLRPEEIPGSFYHYTHGLKKHDGNCQRIAHGHRSRLYIAVDDVRDAELEQQWSETWKDIYIGSAEDEAALTQLQCSTAAQQCTSESHVGYSYTADQGLFELIMPVAENYIIPTDSTVECLAQYLADKIAADLPPTTKPRRVQVTGFEGVGKGAIAYATT